MAEDAFSSEEELGRRKFLTGIIGVVAGLVGIVVGLPAVGYIVSPALKKQAATDWVTLGPFNSLSPGVPAGYPYARTVQDGWVESTVTGVAYAVTYDGTDLTVFSDVCTHLSCRVTWHDDRSHFICPCHDGHFDVHGEVVAGPPPRPLDRFPSKVENGQIQVMLEAQT